MSNDPRNIFFDQRGQTETIENVQNVAETFASNNDDVQKRVEEMKKLAEKYQRSGEGQLIKDIINTVVEQKARGQLSNDQLLNFAKRVSPMLNNDQRERLNGLIEQLLEL